MKHYKFMLVIAFIFGQNIFALNELTVRVPDIYLSYPGYIDKATLVVEPYGGYSEQSLYLEYSDHGQFSSGQKVEIIHRFELPQGAVINDLWLWMGDSVMQAIMLDTWIARSIYDSIVSMKRDPAFLTKKGNQYELHIYPLDPGSFRKVKINYIVPTRWIAKQAVVELPLSMLKSNNNDVQPLDVLFRVEQNIWGTPLIKELPGQQFSNLTDTLGYNYKFTHVGDISPLNSFKLDFDINLIQGTFFRSNEYHDSLNYFQLSLLLKDIFELVPDSTSKKVLVGLDLSSPFNKNYVSLKPNIKSLLKSSLKSEDYFNVIVTGSGRIKKLSEHWLPSQSSTIDEIIDSFFNSAFADSISINKMSRLIYADGQAATCWGFTDVDSFAVRSIYTRLYDASNYFHQADIIASYNQGFEDVPSDLELLKIIASLDSFFLAGGRFLTYYDFNRDYAGENVATHYIQGLRTKFNEHDNVTLYRNSEGNIGLDFPESIDHGGTYFLQYDDPDVKIELMNANGDPAVISKRLGNGGLIVVSGIWSFNDDAPLRKLLAVPLLGLNKSIGTPNQLSALLEKVKIEYIADQFDKTLILSNSDSLVLETPAKAWADTYLSQFGEDKPLFNSINLLNGVFPSVTVNGILYYGGGYLLKRISELTYGLHFETYSNDWDFISSLLSPYALPQLEEFTVKKTGDNNPDKIEEFRQIIQEPQDNNSPLFYIGSTSASKNVSFDISAKFAGVDSIKERSFTFPISYDTTKIIISSMLGYEKIKDLFANAGYDTSQIVSIALKYNLLCDYTALIALEPNDTIHFLDDPFDEGKLTNVENEVANDSLQVSIYPNPFNSTTKILVSVMIPSRVNIYVYNILGQLVKVIVEGEEIVSSKSYFWNGVDSHNTSVSSGVYLLRIAVKDKTNNSERSFIHKLMLLK